MEARSIPRRPTGQEPVDFAAWRQWREIARSCELDELELLLAAKLASCEGRASRAFVGEALGVDSSELSRLINRAEEDELVLRVSEADHRRVSLELLDRGWDALDKVSGISEGTADAPDARFQIESLISRCLAANRQLRAFRRDNSLTFSQAVCLVAATQLGIRPQEPSAAAQVNNLTGMPRTTARTALSQLAARGLFS